MASSGRGLRDRAGGGVAAGYLAGTALDHDMASLPDGAGLHRNSGGGTGIRVVELDVVLVIIHFSHVGDRRRNEEGGSTRARDEFSGTERGEGTAVDDLRGFYAPVVSAPRGGSRPAPRSGARGHARRRLPARRLTKTQDLPVAMASSKTYQGFFPAPGTGQDQGLKSFTGFYRIKGLPAAAHTIVSPAHHNLWYFRISPDDIPTIWAPH